MHVGAGKVSELKEGMDAGGDRGGGGSAWKIKGLRNRKMFKNEGARLVEPTTHLLMALR